MSRETTKVLLIEDNPADAQLIREELTVTKGVLFKLECAERLSAGLERLAAGDIDVVLLDLALPDSEGFETFLRAYMQAPQMPMIVLSGLDDEELATKAVQEGAQDYLVKERMDGDLLARAIRYAIERKRVEERLRRHNEELAMLNRAGQALGSTLDLDQVLVAVLEEVRNLLGVVATSVWLIDPETNELICRQATGPQNEIVRGWRLAPGEGLAGWVVRSGESLIVSDIRVDERHSKKVDRETGLALRAVLSVPLRVGQKMIGVLQVVDGKVGRFDAEDLELLEPLAAAAAIAIENARLYKESKRLQAFNEDIVQSLEEGILLENAAGHFVFANPKAAALLGYTPEELVGQRWADIVAPGHKADIEERGDRWTEGVVIRYETVLQTSEGRQMPAIVGARWLYDEGRLAGVLSAFADITARKQAEEKIRQRNEELTILNTIAVAVSHSLDLQEILNAALQETMAVLGAEGGIVHLFDENSRLLSPVIHRGLAAGVLKGIGELEPGKGILGQAVQTGRPLLVVDMMKAPRNVSSAALKEGGWQSLISVPLEIKGRVSGMMTIIGRRKGQFTPGHLSLPTAVGNQIGMAIESARLFEAIRADRKQLQALSDRLVEVQEKGHRHASRELHDEIGQALTRLKLVLDVAANSPDGDVEETLKEATTLVDELLDRVHDQPLNLRPPLLGD